MSLMRIAISCLTLTCLALVATALSAATRDRASQESADASVVELFDAMQSGQIDVRLVMKDAARGNVIVQNKSDRPLSVKLPELFAGVPALAQDVGGGGRGGRGNRNNGGGGNQSTGGGFGGGGGGGGGFFNVPPEKFAQIKVDTVCLEHGKDNPRASIPYKIVPIGDYTKDVAVHEVLAMMGRGEIGQRVAQAAAWHLENGMSWEQLAAEHNTHANGTSEPFFSRSELQLALKAVALAKKTADEKSSKSSDAPEKDKDTSRF